MGAAQRTLIGEELKRRLIMGEKLKRTLIIGAMSNEPHILTYKREHKDQDVYTIDFKDADFNFDFNDATKWIFLKEEKIEFDSIIFDYSVGKFVELDDEVLFNVYLYNILKEGGSIYIYADIKIQNPKEAWVKLEYDNLVKVFCKESPPPLTNVTLNGTDASYHLTFNDPEFEKYKCNSIKSTRGRDTYFKQYYKEENKYEVIYIENIFQIVANKYINIKYIKSVFSEKYNCEVISIDKYPLKHPYINKSNIDNTLFRLQKKQNSSLHSPPKKRRLADAASAQSKSKPKSKPKFKSKTKSKSKPKSKTKTKSKTKKK
jgi:hypothetical protein